MAKENFKTEKVEQPEKGKVAEKDINGLQLVAVLNKIDGEHTYYAAGELVSYDDFKNPYQNVEVPQKDSDTIEPQYIDVTSHRPYFKEDGTLGMQYRLVRLAYEYEMELAMKQAPILASRSGGGCSSC